MSRSPDAAAATAAVLAQWDAWATRCTDRLFDLDARATAHGTADDRLDVAAAFVARKAIVDRLAAMRTAVARDHGAATALAAQPLVDEHGERVADDLPSAAALTDAILRRIEGHLDEVEARESAIIGTVTAIEAALTEAGALAERLGSHVQTVAALRDRQSHTPRSEQSLGELRRDATSVLHDLRAADAERTALLDALDDAPREVERLRTREAAVRALVDEARGKVTPLPNLAVPSVEALGPVPDHAGLPWPAARARLQPWLERLRRLGPALDECSQRYSAVLARRNDLRGLLQAYRDKAAASGLAEDPDLEPRYRAARDLLWSAPCDVDEAEPLVTDYTRAVNALVGRGDVPGSRSTGGGGASERPADPQEDAR